MDAPVCEKCVRSGILCPECKEKFDKEELTRLDIELAALLYKFENQELIKEPSFEKTFSVDDLVIVLTKGSVPNLIGRKGRVVRQLSKNLHKTVRIIKDGDIKEKMSDLVAPARLEGINIVYRKGQQATKIVVSGRDRDKLITSKETLEKAARLLAEDDTITFDFK